MCLQGNNPGNSKQKMSLWNKKDLIGITSKIIIVLNTNRFQLTKFVSSSQTVIKSLPSSEISPKFVNLDLGSDASEGTLCLIRNINRDKLSAKPVTKSFIETKEGILSMISTVYDSIKIYGKIKQTGLIRYRTNF